MPILRLPAFLIAVSATFLAGFIGMSLLPHDPYIRYQTMQGTIFERATWMYERLHFDPAPVDIVLVGSSRTARGIDPGGLEAALAAKALPRHVVNLSLAASGYDLQLTLAREALETREVKLLVVSLVEQFPRDGHQAFADLANAGDIVASPWLVNRNFVPNLLRLPIRQLQLLLKSRMPEAFGLHADFDPEAYRLATADPRFAPLTEAAPKKTAAQIAALEAESAFRHHDLTLPVLPASLSWVEFGMTRSYIRQLAALAKAEGAKLVFLYLPFYKGYQRPFEQQWLEQYAPVLSADFLLSDPANYNDVAHASRQGTALLTNWLADELAPILEAAP